MKRHSFAGWFVAGAVLATVPQCTKEQQAAAIETERDVCAIVAPPTDGGLSLLQKIVEDLESLERLERAKASPVATNQDAGARDGAR